VVLTPVCRSDPANGISGLPEVPTEHLWHRIGIALLGADLLRARIIGIKMDDESSFVMFYVDDSTCQIGGKKHFILAAVSFESEDATLSHWIQQKEKFGCAE
jgi:hypothetical protein